MSGKIKTCGNCIEDKKPMFTLITHKDSGKKVERYFCSYKCLVYDVLGALGSINSDISDEILEQLIKIVED